MPQKSPALGHGVPSWSHHIAALLSRKQVAPALRFLDRIIENDLPLFNALEDFQADRRSAWLARIDLLRERGRLAEALAWTCLECELNPLNVAAQALKEQLKRHSGLGTRPEEHTPAAIQAPRVSWDGVAGMRELKAILERDIVLPLQEPALYKRYRLDPPNGLLLYGPPGCGKTFIARALSSRVSYNFREVKASELASIYVHGSQGMIAQLFKEALEKAPIILFFDEIDAMIPTRSGSGVGHSYGTEVNEFLVQLNDCGKRGILAIGATNMLSKVDPAARRPGRFDKQVLVGPPDVEARVEALRLHMNGRPQDAIDWVALAEGMANYSFAELELVVNEAARIALAERRNVQGSDLGAAARHNPAQPKHGFDSTS